MKFSEALESITGTNKRITRDLWYGYKLKFDGNGYLVLMDGKSELTPYVISEFDFNYEWEIEE